MGRHGVASTLAAHVTVSSSTAETWYRVAHGELTADEAAHQLAEDGSFDEQALERARAVFVPLTPEREQEQLEALVARHEAERRARSSRRWAVGVLAAAASVVLTLWLVPSPPPEQGAFTAGYTVELENAAAMQRGSSTEVEVPTFLPTGKIQIWLRPERAVEGAVDVVGSARATDGSVRPLALELRTTTAGVIQIESTPRALGLSEGQWELVFAIGRPPALPSWEDLAAHGRSDAAYEIVHTHLRVVTRL